MFPYLRNQRVNLQLLQDSECRQLVQLLESIEGSKIVVLDEAMIGPLGLVVKPKVFSDRNIMLVALKADSRFAREMQNVIYIMRPQVSLMDQLVNHVKNNGQPAGRQYHIFFVPRRSCLCIKQLEDKEVINAFGRLEELPWNFLPVDADVVSMEMPNAFREVKIDGDTTSLYQAAIGLVQLQRLYGRIPKIYGKGVHAQMVWEHAKQLALNEKSLYNGDKGAIDQLILLDRSIDLLTPLATQLTYEGLIDEFYGIRQNQLTLPAEYFPSYNTNPAAAVGGASGSGAGGSGTSAASNEQQRLLSEGNRKTLMLHSGEELYAELRDKNFNEVRMMLARKVRDIQLQMNVNRQDQTVKEIKHFVERLSKLMDYKRATSEHTAIAELIAEKVNAYAFNDDLAAEQEFMICADVDRPCAYIEDKIARRAELRDVLRLMCLQCAAATGFKERVLNYYKRELAQVYGLEVLLTISNLEKAGLLHTQTESRAYAVLRKTLHLTVEDSVEVNPRDISYVHSFYAPLTARLVEHSLKPLGWQTLKSQINNLPGPTFEGFQVPLVGIGGRYTVGSGTINEASLLHARRVVLVCFVGGCTFAEIAALRFLAEQEDNNVQFVIATTKIINKNTFLDSLIGT